MCDSCINRFRYVTGKLPGLHLMGYVYLRAPDKALHVAWVYWLAVSTAENGELLYRMALPMVHVRRCYSTPGWLFVVTPVG